MKRGVRSRARRRAIEVGVFWCHEPGIEMDLSVPRHRRLWPPSGEYAHQSRPSGALRPPPSAAGRTGMDVLYARCAGLDVHKKRVLVCVLVTPERGAPRKAVRTFGTLADEVLALGDWL